MVDGYDWRHRRLMGALSIGIVQMVAVQAVKLRPGYEDYVREAMESYVPEDE